MPRQGFVYHATGSFEMQAIAGEALMTIDPESLRTLKNLVQSLEVSLNGLDRRIRRELEVVEVSMSLAKRVQMLLSDLLDAPQKKNDKGLGGKSICP